MPQSALLSTLGKVRIGGADATPDKGYLGWFSMLFAAGVRIGLIFFGVLEPADYFGAPWGDQPLGRELGIVDGGLLNPAARKSGAPNGYGNHHLSLGPAPMGHLFRGCIGFAYIQF